MPSLHFPTVMFNMLVICTVCSIVIALILQKRRKNYRGLGRLSSMFGLHAFGLLLLVLQGTLPVFWTSFIANAIIAAGFWVGLNGIETFVDRKNHQWISCIIYLCFLGLHFHWLYLQPDIHLRNVNLASIVFLFSIRAAYRLITPKDPEMLKFTRPSAWIFLAFSSLLAFRIYIILSRRDLNQVYLNSEGLEPLFFILFQIAYVLITFFLLVMVNKRLLHDKEQALSEIKTLSGMLPICSSCKNIRDDQGYWKQIEDYLHTHHDARFSHSLCPGCAKKLYPDLYEELKADLH